ncbi:hypothetical protein ACH5RR_000888 [Cinchona calisaya]|uniref:Uncharacterized protein n=1 Tax=Cinchona calisaya TaxID=153742 RepID=A0ABD3B313_9GENT
MATWTEASVDHQLNQEGNEEKGQELMQSKQQRKTATCKRTKRKRGKGGGEEGTWELPSNQPEKEFTVIYNLPYQLREGHKKLKENIKRFYQPYAECCRDMVQKGMVDKVFCKTMEWRSHRSSSEYRARFVDENIEDIVERLTELENVLLQNDPNADPGQVLFLVARLYWISAGLGLGKVKSDCYALRYCIKSSNLTGSEQQFKLLKKDFEDFNGSYLKMVEMEKDMENNNVFIPMWPKNGAWKIPKAGRMMTITNHPEDIFDDEIIDY